MAASYGKVSTAHREAIYDLKKAGKPGRVIREQLKAGYSPTGDVVDALDPVDLSISECNRIGKRLMDERDELFSSKVQTKAPHEGLALLTKRLIVVAERETVRQEAAVKRGQLDANKLGRLATALVRLHGLVERSEQPVPDPEPTAGGSAPDPEPGSRSFADELALEEDGDAVHDPVPALPTGAPAAIADQVLTPGGAPLGRPPAPAQTVSPDLPPTAGPGGESLGGNMAGGGAVRSEG